MTKQEINLDSYYIRAEENRPGKKGTVKSDPEKEKARLKANLASRIYKAKKKAQAMAQEAAYAEILGIDLGDKYGIRAVDERRYVKCFHSGYIGEIPSLDYVRRMTGLSLNQVYILQQRTNHIPYPAVTKAIAATDEQRRINLGDIY